MVRLAGSVFGGWAAGCSARADCAANRKRTTQGILGGNKNRSQTTEFLDRSEFYMEQPSASAHCHCRRPCVTCRLCIGHLGAHLLGADS